MASGGRGDGRGRCGSARALTGSPECRGARGSMRGGRRVSTGGRSSAGARSIATASAAPTESDGSRLEVPSMSRLLGGTADRESLDGVATSSAGARVGSEARRLRVSSDLPVSVTISTTATTPSATVPTTKKSERRSGAPRFLPTARRHSRSRSSRSRSSDSGSCLSRMGPPLTFDAPGIRPVRGREACQKHNGALQVGTRTAPHELWPGPHAVFDVRFGEAQLLYVTMVTFLAAKSSTCGRRHRWHPRCHTPGRSGKQRRTK